MSLLLGISYHAFHVVAVVVVVMAWVFLGWAVVHGFRERRREERRPGYLFDRSDERLPR